MWLLLVAMKDFLGRRLIRPVGVGLVINLLTLLAQPTMSRVCALASANSHLKNSPLSVSLASWPRLPLPNNHHSGLKSLFNEKSGHNNTKPLYGSEFPKMLSLPP